MEDVPTWASLFERADTFETDETAISTALRAVRGADGDGR